MYDDEPIFLNESNLAWKNYTRSKDIIPNKEISSLFITYEHKNDEKIKSNFLAWCSKQGLSFEDTTNSLYEEIIEISENKLKIATGTIFEGCLTIQLSNDKESLFEKLIQIGFGDGVISSAVVPHIFEKYSLENNITINKKTGLAESGGFYPKSFYTFWENGRLIGKVLLGYSESEFMEIGPILIMFQVAEKSRRHGYGTMMVEFIEKQMCDLGFWKMYLSDTRSNEFWRKMDYEIDIDEGEKELDCFDYED